MYYNRFRYYSPEEGIYISQDPIRLYGGKNLYNYVKDPNKFIDFLGLSDNLFRGTTEGYPGNQGTQKAGVTPTSTDPRVATVFATHASTNNGGQGVVIIANKDDLAGVNIDSNGNGSTPTLATIEREVLVETTPSEFAKLASVQISAEDSRKILSEMGYDLPANIHDHSDITTILRDMTDMTDEEIAEYMNRVENLCNNS